jgi:hypothetical protein
VSDEQRLRRAYERLILVYPRWYRRERGLELLTTLLDDAQPGQRRPGRAEVADLLRGGLRARLRPPRGVAWLVAALLALLAGLAGAAAAVELTPYPGPPDEAAAVAAATLATGRAPRDTPGPVVRCTWMCPVPAGDDVVSYDHSPDQTDRVVVTFHQPRDEAAALVARARDRLAGGGWRVGPLDEHDGVVSFAASRGELRVDVSSATGIHSYDDQSGDVLVVATKAHSPVAVAALALGFLGGLLAGWPLAVWLLHRHRRHRPARRLAATAAALPLLLLAGWAVGGSVLLAVATGSSGFAPRDVLIPQFVLSTLLGLAVPATVAVAVGALIAAALTARPGAAPAAPPRPAGEPA